VVVNIPAAQIEAVQGDHVVSRHAAVVGKVDRRTPILRSKIHQVNFNPYWHIPQSIVRKDLVPKAKMYARRGKDILSEYRIDAYSGNRKLDPRKINWNSSAVYSYAYRQQPWKDNSMGFVKINFHNGHSVYMHDTPSKSLFSRNFRAHSSGCVRVQNVKQLVSWLLEANGGWDIAKVTQMKQTGARKDVNLKRRVPVYFVYITAWATKDGSVNFRRDLYGRDRVGPTASAY
jgi:murein L,D-transpeptidase YcbB/YkuD